MTSRLMRASLTIPVALLIACVSALIAACNNAPTVETRTFPLKQLSPTEAVALIEGYVPGGTSKMRATTEPPVLTVSAPRSRLDQVAQVLKTYDKPAPNAQLTFQVIEANGFTATDPAIADVEAALREVFKFEGYKLLATGIVSASAPGHFQTSLGGELIVTGSTKQAGPDAVNLVELGLWTGSSTKILTTSVTVPYGETVVVGSSAPTATAKNALILVVRNKRK